MSNKICTVTDCEQSVHGRGFCSRHYRRLIKHGDPLFSSNARSPEEAFSRYTAPGDGGCLLWIAGRDKDGYGNMRLNGQKSLAHRYAWERANGPIPVGMQIDHKCWNPSCVNIEHLRLANHAENQHYRNGSHRGSKTGMRNVYEREGRYQVMVGHNGKQRSYGYFSTPEEASRLAAQKRAELFGEFAGRG